MADLTGRDKYKSSDISLVIKKHNTSDITICQEIQIYFFILECVTKKIKSAI